MVVRELVVLLGMKTDEKSVKKAEGAIDGLKKSAVTLGAVLLSGAVVAGFNKLIGLASESAETMNKFGAVFLESQGMVQASLDETSKRTGIASLELQQFASSIGAIVKPALGSSEAAGKVGATMAELALDIASFNDVRPDEALVALRSGLIGSAEPLQRFGVDVRVAALEQEALRLGMRGSLKEMSEGQRIQIRTSAILRQLGSQGALGDATKTSKEFANASRALASQVKQLGATIGGFLLKDAGRTVAIYTKIVTAVNDWIGVNRELIQQRVDKVLQVINNTIEGGVRVLMFIVDGWRQLSDLIGPVASNMLTLVGILAAMVAILGAPITLFLALGAAIGLVIDDLVVFANGGKSAFGLLIESLKGFIGEFDTVPELFDRLLDIAIGFWNDFFGLGESESSTFFRDVAAKASEFASTASAKAVEIFQSVSGKVRAFIEENGPRVLAFLKEMGGKVTAFVKEAFSGTLGRIIIDFLGAKAGAAVGEFMGRLIGRLAGKLVGTGALGKIVGSRVSEELLALLGKGAGAIGGGILADRSIGSRLPELIGGGTGGATTSNVSVEVNMSGGASPQQTGAEVARQVKRAMVDTHRQTFNQFAGGKI